MDMQSSDQSVGTEQFNHNHALTESKEITPTYSIVIPVFNEKDNIKLLLERTLKVCRAELGAFELILIDDGSSDISAKMLTEAALFNPDVKAILLNRNYGQHSAIMAGFTHARGEYVITLDADLQNPPEEIPKLAEKLKQGYEVVAGKRAQRQDTFFRRYASKMVNKATATLTGVNMTDYGCMLRGYNKTIIKAMLGCNERSTFIPALANSFSQRTIEIDVEHASRSAGESKYGLWQLINLQFDLLTSISTTPLRLLTMVGLLNAGIGVVLGIWIFIQRILHGAEWAVDGMFTLFAFLFVFMGVQLIGMGLLGEYIGRIYTDVRQRPQFLVRDIVQKQ